VPISLKSTGGERFKKGDVWKEKDDGEKMIVHIRKSSSKEEKNVMRSNKRCREEGETPTKEKERRV